MSVGISGKVRLSLVVFVSMALCGCDRVSGRPGLGPEVIRPEQVLDFSTLYKANCAGCHGENGEGGATIAMANPVYLSVAGEENLTLATANGIHGTLMPAFARHAGGTLTDEQIRMLVHGMMRKWGATGASLQGIPAYKASLAGDPVRGQHVFGVFCGACHGADGRGRGGEKALGSLVDPAYLDLISDQALRSLVIAGMPGQGMPDWRSDGALAMSDQEITDVVAWLTAQRTANPGQPYASHP